VFSVSGGVLEQNTMGQPSSATNLYGIYGAIDPSLPFTLDFTARVLEYVVEPGWQGYGFGIGFWFDNGTERVAIGLSPNRIVKYTTLGVDPSPISTSIDTTQFHDYRLEGAPGVGWEFYADDLFIASGAFGASVRNELLFGDGTITSSARAEVTAYSFSQVPEPTTFTLLGLGSLAFLVFRQKR